ncbi:MAG TPA: VOC family protein [Alphaproteobacteria bacterium]|jgi:catechol 2,3-dioxygenase-like lactoylglutathione lyase family enzyme/nitrite reductase/ring-hydroxylating ferredoxin subunit|nr:VOC family protein [Alphaproteobacteria bacterium]
MVHMSAGDKFRPQGEAPRHSGAVSGFSHLIIEVTDLDRSEKFYQDVFGLDVIGRDLLSEIGPNSTLAFNTRHRFVLVQVPATQPFRKNSSSIHHAVWLTPEQFDRAEARLKERGYDIGDNRAQFRPLGERSIDIFDPDGHRYQVQCFGPESTAIIVENVGEVNCGNVADYAPGAVKTFMKGKFFVIRHAEGFIALSRWCTHKNGLLAYQPEHWRFYCPMHGATYNRKGESISMCRDLAPMRQHPLSIASDGTITVRPDEVIRRETFDVGQLTACAAEPATAG